MQITSTTKATTTFYVVLALFLIACEEQPARAQDSPAPPATAAIMQETVVMQYAIYYLPRSQSDPIQALRELLADEYTEIELVEDAPDSITKRYMRALVESNVKEEYPPPPLDSLQYFGRGLSRDQAVALQDSQQAVILDFAHPRAVAVDALRSTNRLLEQLARRTDGLIWDEQTREVFTPDQWHTWRVADWHEGIPVTSRQIVIHAYNTGEYVRAISLGMSKFGMPDIVINGFPWSLNRPMGNLINVTTQAIVEGTVMPIHGDAEINLRTLTHPGIRDENLDTLKPNGDGIARLKFIKGTWEEGDPNNSLIEIVFDRYPGVDVHARQNNMLSSLWGWEDSVTRIDHNEELLAASREAVSHLPALRQAFNKGLQPGEFIQVKAPFPTPDGGNEWMWVEVTQWSDDQIKGILKNEPFDIPDLHGGQIVVVNQNDIFDYLHRHADGTEEGNTTAQIIMKMQGHSE